MPARSPRSRKRHTVARASSRGGAPAHSGIKEDIKALNSSILLISQKMKYVVRNEKILGRNLIVLNRKLKKLEDSIESGAGGGALSAEQVVEISDQLKKMNERLALTEAQISEIRDTYAPADQLKELKYVIDSINPLEFVTIKQVEELINKKLKR